VPDRRRAWARALFLAAPDRESRSAYADALEALSGAIESDARIREFLTDPSADKKAKGSLLVSALGAAKGEGAAVFERFCVLLVEKGRIMLLSDIARSYGAFRDADEGLARLEVEAAREVDAAALDRIAKAWSAYSGAKSTRTRVRLNPALIAGYRLRAGSLRIDYSVAGRLERLKRELARPLGQARGEG
jgi:F-type H+-transporting ATPase subunit delta